MGTNFVSYSRRDQDFVLALKAALVEAGQDTWIDVEGLRPSEQWRTRLESAIDEARAVVVVLSPDWLASPECRREFEHATRGRKKIVPVVCRDVAPMDAPEALRELNWIHWRPQDDARAAAARTVEAIETDLEWVDRHTALLNKARAWDRSGRRSDLLPRGAELKESEDWISQAAAHPKMPPSSLHAEFILSGRRAATKRRRIGAGAVAFVLVLSGGLGGWAIQVNQLRVRDNQLSAQQAEIDRKDKALLAAEKAAADAKRDAAEKQAKQEVELKQEQASLRQVAEGYRVIFRDPTQAAVHALRAAQHQRSPDAERAMVDAWRVAIAQRENRLAMATLRDIESMSFERRERPGEVYSVIGHNGRHVLIATERVGSAHSPQVPGEVYLLDSETLRTVRLRVCGKGVGQPRLEYAGFSSAGDRVFVARAFYIDVYDLAGACLSDQSLQLEGTKAAVHIVGGYLARRFLLASDSEGRIWLIDAEGKLPRRPLEGLGRRTYDLTSPGNALVDIQVAPDGRLALVVYESGRSALVRVAADGRMAHAALDSGVLAVAFDPRAGGRTRWASGHVDGQVRLWQFDGQRATRLQRLSHAGMPVDTLAYSDDGTILVSIDGRCTLRLWDTTLGALLHTQPAQRQAVCKKSARADEVRRAHAAGPAAPAVVTAKLADPEPALPTGARIEQRLTDARAEILGLALSPDGRWIAAGSEDGAVHVWRRRDGRLAHRWTFDDFDGARALAFSPDGSRLLALSDAGHARVWTLPGGQPLRLEPPPDREEVQAVVYTGRDTIAVASDTDLVMVWDFVRGTRLGEPDIGFEQVRSLLLTPDGARLIVGSEAGPPVVLAAKDGRVLEEFDDEDPAPLLALSADGRLLAGSDGDVLALWSTHPVSRLERPFALPGPRLTSIALSPDGRVLAAGFGNGLLRLWRTDSGQELADLRGGHGVTAVAAVRFTPDGGTLISGGVDRQVVIWRLER